MTSMKQLLPWSQAAEPLTRQASHSPSSSLNLSTTTSKSVTVTFHLQAWVSPGLEVYVAADLAEFGCWSDVDRLQLHPEEMYCVWRSAATTFDVSGNEFSLRYFYYKLNVDTRECEELTPVRGITIQLGLVSTLDYTLIGDLSGPDQVTFNTAGGCSLLRNISLTGLFAVQLDQLLAELHRKTGRMSLKSFLALGFYFKQTFASQSVNFEFASSKSCEKLLSITKLLCSQMTEEIRPIVTKTVLWMGRCCPPYKGIMKSITHARLIQHKKVQFGCESQVLEELLDELVSHSPRDEMGMVRVIVLNSIRGVIRSLMPKSTRPELLLMYDVWISVLQRSYIQSQFLSSDPSNARNLLHQVSLLAEYCRLGGICPGILPLAEGINDNQDATTAHALVRMLETATSWLARYVDSAKRLGGQDWLGLRQYLIDTGAESVDMLFPVLTRALHAIRYSLNSTFTVSLCHGEATGKVLTLPNFSELPPDFSAVIVLLPAANDRTGNIPSQVAGIVQLDDLFLCSHMVAHCLQNKLPLGIVAGQWKNSLRNKVQLRVTQDEICLL